MPENKKKKAVKCSAQLGQLDFFLGAEDVSSFMWRASGLGKPGHITGWSSLYYAVYIFYSSLLVFMTPQSSLPTVSHSDAGGRGFGAKSVCFNIHTHSHLLTQQIATVRCQGNFSVSAELGWHQTTDLPTHSLPPPRVKMVWKSVYVCWARPTLLMPGSGLGPWTGTLWKVTRLAGTFV